VTSPCIAPSIDPTLNRSYSQWLVLFRWLAPSQVIHKEGVLKLTAKELHSFDSMSAFAVMLRHTYKATALELGDGKADLNAEYATTPLRTEGHAPHTKVVTRLRPVLDSW
jgi:hypothetical protein